MGLQAHICGTGHVEPIGIVPFGGVGELVQLSRLLLVIIGQDAKHSCNWKSRSSVWGQCVGAVCGGSSVWGQQCVGAVCGGSVWGQCVGAVCGASVWGQCVGAV